MKRLRMTSLMSEIAEPFCTDVASYLSACLSIPVHFTAEDDFSARRRWLDQQQVDIAWVCGLLYVQKAQAPTWQYRPIVAPCMMGESAAVYYGDVIVQHNSTAQNFADLRGASWAYNEEESFSGFQIMCAQLAAMGESGPFFGRRIQSGAHLDSIEMVHTGRVETAVIDSTVLQMATAADHVLADGLRVISRIGPYSMPPLVIATRLPAQRQRKIADALLTMSTNAAGSTMLARHQISHFVPVDDRAYNDIRTMMAATNEFNL